MIFEIEILNTKYLRVLKRRNSFQILILFINSVIK